jgi:hypothetical protein
VRSCGRGGDIGLPANVWECTLIAGDERGTPEASSLLWTDTGRASVETDRPARIERLDGAVADVRARGAVEVTERPILVRRPLAR